MSRRKQCRRCCSAAEPVSWPPWVKESVRNIPNRDQWSITFFGSVVVGILVGTTREDWCLKCRLWNDETSPGPRLIGSLSFSIRGGGLCFSVVHLWSQSFFCPTKIHPPGTNKAYLSNKCIRCLSRPSVRLLRGGDNRRGAWKLWGQRGRGHIQFHPPRWSRVAPSSQYHTSRRPHSGSPNEHSCPHSAWQWSPPLPLSCLTMRNIAPIKPQRQWPRVGKGVEVCA